MSDITTMVPLFQWIVRAILVAALLGKFLLLYTVVARFSPSLQERIMRSIAAVCGLLLYLGAKTLGLSVARFLLYSLTMSGALLTGFLGALLPGALGFIVSWHVCHFMNSRNRRRNLVGMRILAMTMAMVTMLYVDCFIAATDPTHGGDIKLLLPNLTFVLSVMLYAVFKYYPLPDDAATGAEA